MPNPTLSAQIQALRERNPLWCMREICDVMDGLNGEANDLYVLRVDYPDGDGFWVVKDGSILAGSRQQMDQLAKASAWAGAKVIVVSATMCDSIDGTTPAILPSSTPFACDVKAQRITEDTACSSQPKTCGTD